MVGSLTKLSMYDVSSLFDNLKVRSVWTMVFVINPVVPNGLITLTKCGDKRNGTSSGMVVSLVPAPKAKLKSMPCERKRKINNVQLICVRLPSIAASFRLIKMLDKCRSPMPSTQCAMFIVAMLETKFVRSTKKLSGETLKSISAFFMTSSGSLYSNFRKLLIICRPMDKSIKILSSPP